VSPQEFITAADTLPDARLVRSIAERLSLLEGNALVPLDSLAVASLITELEAAFRVEVPLSDYRAERFASIDRIVEMLSTIARQS
jgi:acyl carrier protein